MLIVDRVEGGLAVVETDDGHVDVPVSEISGHVRDGVVLVQEDGTYLVDEDATRERLDRISEKAKGLFR